MKKLPHLLLILSLFAAPLACRQIYMSNSAMHELETSRERLAGAVRGPEAPPAKLPSPKAITASEWHNSDALAIYMNLQAGLAAGFTDKALAQLMKFAASALDRAVQEVENKFRSDFTLTCRLNGKVESAGNNNWFVLRRAIRVPLDHFYDQSFTREDYKNDQGVEASDHDFDSGILGSLKNLAKPRFTPSVWNHYIRPMISKDPAFEISGDDWESGARDGWNRTLGENGEETLAAQLTTHEVGLQLEMQPGDPQTPPAIAIRAGYLRVFLSDSALPNYEDVRGRFLDILRKGGNGASIGNINFNELLGKLYTKADEKLVDELSLRVGMEIKLIWNDMNGTRHERAVTTGVKNIWPADTLAFTHDALGQAEYDRLAKTTPACNPGSGAVLWAPVYALNFDNQEWAPMPAGPLTIQVRILETSQFVDLLERAREALKDWTEKQTKK